MRAGYSHSKWVAIVRDIQYSHSKWVAIVRDIQYSHSKWVAIVSRYTSRASGAGELAFEMQQACVTEDMSEKVLRGTLDVKAATYRCGCMSVSM